MQDNYLNLKAVVEEQQEMLRKEQELYMSSVKNINMRFKELINVNLGSQLVKMCAKDISGEVVRRYFDTSDYQITPDQMFDRIVNFSYDSDVFNDSIKKDFYNINDSKNSQRINEIQNDSKNMQKQLFDNDRSQDRLDVKGKLDYRKLRTTSDGKLYDELTGNEGTVKTIYKNGKAVKVSELQADHIQPREGIMFNEKYIRADKKESLKKFYNSKDNMQMMYASANSSKKDVRVCIVNGKEEFLQSNEMKSRISKGEKIEEITYKATPEQLANATIAQWEKETATGDKIKNLKEHDYLDENGKVKSEVKEKLMKNIKKSQRKESIELLKDTNYKEVSGDAFKKTTQSMGKVLIGQVVYYVLPPLVFETQQILKKDDVTLKSFWEKLSASSKRIMDYIISKLGDVFKNIFGHSVKNFVKIFFDILINIVKDVIKRFMKILKTIVMSLISCVKIIVNKETSAAEKADAVTKILATAISGIVLEVVFEYLEKQFSIPDIIAEPLQIIVTTLATNLIMIILEKADLFNVKHGLLVANIESVFEEENNRYMKESTELRKSGNEKINRYICIVIEEISYIKEGIKNLNMYEDDVAKDLDKINKIFDMQIDFNHEWNSFIGRV